MKSKNSANPVTRSNSVEKTQSALQRTKYGNLKRTEAKEVSERGQSTKSVPASQSSLTLEGVSSSISGYSRDLKLIYESPSEAASEFNSRPRQSARLFILKHHIPWLIALPILSFLSPLRFILGKSFDFKSSGIVPIALAIGFLVLTAIYDKMVFFSTPPASRDVLEYDPSNRGLWLALPVSMSAVFYIIHPFFGWVITLFSCGYVAAIQIWTTPVVEKKSILNSISLYLLSTIFLVLILVILALAFNAMRSIAILRQIF